MNVFFGFFFVHSKAALPYSLNEYYGCHRSVLTAPNLLQACACLDHVILPMHFGIRMLCRQTDIPTYIPTYIYISREMSIEQSSVGFASLAQQRRVYEFHHLTALGIPMALTTMLLNFIHTPTKPHLLYTYS